MIDESKYFEWDEDEDDCGPLRSWVGTWRMISTPAWVDAAWRHELSDWADECPHPGPCYGYSAARNVCVADCPEGQCECPDECPACEALGRRYHYYPESGHGGWVGPDEAVAAEILALELDGPMSDFRRLPPGAEWSGSRLLRATGKQVRKISEGLRRVTDSCGSPAWAGDFVRVVRRG